MLLVAIVAEIDAPTDGPGTLQQNLTSLQPWHSTHPCLQRMHVMRQQVQLWMGLLVCSRSASTPTGLAGAGQTNQQQQQQQQQQHRQEQHQQHHRQEQQQHWRDRRQLHCKQQ